MLILISDAFDPSLPDRLKEFGEVTDDKSRLPEVEVVLIRSKTKCTREYLDQATALKMIIRGGVGLDNVDRDYAKEKGVAVHNTPDASSIAVAELAMALMLAAPNHLVRGHQGMAEGKWLKKELKRSELYGKTLGLIGVGRIGGTVAARAKAFGMRVVGYDKFLETSDIVDLKPLESVLAESDFISLHTPLTDETRGLLNEQALQKVKQGVFVINTGRGGCVDQQAMADALKSGKVGTYASDVWLSDPPTENHALLSAPNTIMLPHIGASTKENLLRIGDTVVELIGEFKRNG